MDVLCVSLSDVVMNFSDFFPQFVNGSGVLLVSVIGVAIVLRRFYVRRKLQSGSTEDWFHPVGICKLVWHFGSLYFRRVGSWFWCLWRRFRCQEKENVVKTSDDFYCGYDSTWEAEEDSEGPERPPAARKPGRVQDAFDRFCRAAKDMQMYRHELPSSSYAWRHRASSSTSDLMPNLDFYLGRTHSQPDADLRQTDPLSLEMLTQEEGVCIKEFHSNWRGQYDALEHTHTFIQWLFPLREPGMNSAAIPLTEEEVKAFCQSREAQENLLESYRLMLDFYGMVLSNDQTGEVRRAENWQQRFHNLNHRSHNNLRITRIIKCLGILGYEHFQAPLVQFFLKETLVEGELPFVKDSVLHYFVFAVRDKEKRRQLLEFAYLNYHPKDEFVWCPKKIQMRLQQEQQQY